MSVIGEVWIPEIKRGGDGSLLCGYCLPMGLTFKAEDEAMARHVEAEHHVPVRRQDESPQECMDRFRREQTKASGPECRCPRCWAVRSGLLPHKPNALGRWVHGVLPLYSTS